MIRFNFNLFIYCDSESVCNSTMVNELVISNKATVEIFANDAWDSSYMTVTCMVPLMFSNGDRSRNISCLACQLNYTDICNSKYY